MSVIAERKMDPHTGHSKQRERQRGVKRRRERESEEEEEKAAALEGPAKAARSRRSSRAPASQAEGKGKARAGGPGEKKAFPKTSSLFKNNPSIPSVERPAVCQRKEAVFAGNAFSTLDLHPHLVSTLDKQMKLSQMTMVQRQAIPILLQGRDALVRSQTGSGKTLAYAVPLVQSLQAVRPKITRGDGPYALIIVPTRELAMQSFHTIQQLLKPFSWVVPGVLMGGEKRKSEKARLRKGINVLVSTPGRLVDHIRHTETLSFSRVAHLVLDEADRLLDLGFEKDLSQILNRLTEESSVRQSVLLSATLSQGITWLAGIVLDDPVSVTVATDEGAVAVTTSGGGNRTVPAMEADDKEDPDGDVGAEEEEEEGTTAEDAQEERATKFSVPPGLTQHFIAVPSKLRLVTLTSFVLAKCRDGEGKMVLFVSSRESAEFLYAILCHCLGGSGPGSKEGGGRDGDGKVEAQTVALWRLHGSVEQQERMEVFDSFCKAPAGVLVCTDVAARGLDLPRVSWIVQYTPAASVEEYVHRVGRTARIGLRGSSLLFLVAPSELALLPVLARHGLSLRELKMETVLRTLLGSSGGRPKRGKWEAAQVKRAAHAKATEMQLQFESFTHSSPERLQLAKKAFQSYVRAYATYPAALKAVFHVRSLHLGHAAKSFGLRDAPGQLAGARGGAGRSVGTRARRSAAKAKPLKPKRRMAFKELLLSEYASGL